MVARNDKQALPKQALPKAALPAAPTLLDCFLDALKKRDGRDHHLQVPINPSAKQSAAAPANQPPLSK